MAIIYPDRPRIPAPVNPLAQGLSGLMEGWESGRKTLKDNQAIDAAYGVYQNAPGQKPLDLSALGGMGGAPSTATVQAGASRRPAASIPQGERASYIRNGLKARGLPEHVADAFVVNFQDESGLDPGVNEAQPLVPGSRGGFGLYQLTGPRRKAYEAFASQKGVDPSDIDAQLDFLNFELKGPEARAAKSIMQAPDTATAAQAIVNNFLRPAPEHRQSRAQRYAGLGGGVQVASADGSGPSAETMNALMTGASGAQSDRAGDPQAAAPTQMAQAAPAGGMDIGRLVSSVSAGQTNGANLTREQFASMMQSEATKPLAMALFQSKVTGDPRAGERALELALRLENMQYERGMDQQRFGLQQEQTAWQRQQAEGAAAASAEERQYDRARDATADARAGRPQITSIYDDQGREQKGYFDQDNQFVPVGGAKAASSSNGVTVMPDGTVQVGGSNMKLTEGQSKDLNYYVRGNAALPTIDAHEGALASGAQKLANGVPVAGNYLTSPEYQVANQAGREFLASILRKDTGAAITKEEEAYYGQMFLPQPGDAPEVLAQKRASRSRALEAMKSGLGTATPLANTPVTQNPTGSLVPGSDAAPQAPQAPRAPVAAPAAGAVEDGYRFKGGDPANPANWEPYT